MGSRTRQEMCGMPAVHVLKKCVANTMCSAVHVLKRCALNTVCSAVPVFKRCVPNTMCSAVHVLKRNALNTICSAVRVFKRCVANTTCSAVNRPEVSPSTSNINIYSSYQNTFTTAIHSSPPLSSALFRSISLTTHPYVKNLNQISLSCSLGPDN